MRTSTPPRVTPDGVTHLTVHRSCNGCDLDLDAAVAGQLLPDVTGECPKCTPPAAVQAPDPLDFVEALIAQRLDRSEVVASGTEWSIAETADPAEFTIVDCDLPTDAPPQFRVVLTAKITPAGAR